MKITSDFHIHTEHSYDGRLKMTTLIRRAAEKGVTDYAATDHFNTPLNLPNLIASRDTFRSVNPPPGFHLGIELSVISRWEMDEVAAGRREYGRYGIRDGGPEGAELALAIDEGLIRELGLEHVMAGVHWPIFTPKEPQPILRDYHRQLLFLAAHPLVDVIAHPWWWAGKWANDKGVYDSDPWCGDFGVIPASMHEEFAAAVLQHGTVVEANVGGMLLTWQYTERFKKQYLDYLAYLAGRGIRLSIGSDTHDDIYGADLSQAEAMLDSVGINESHIWRLPPRQGPPR